MVFFCISLKISDVEHLFMDLFAICMSSLEKYLFKSSARWFFCSRGMSSFYILVNYGYGVKGLQIFFPVP